MNNTAQFERIYRIWSEQREDQIAVRIQYSVQEQGATRLFLLGSREEWL